MLCNLGFQSKCLSSKFVQKYGVDVLNLSLKAQYFLFRFSKLTFVVTQLPKSINVKCFPCRLVAPNNCYKVLKTKFSLSFNCIYCDKRLFHEEFKEIFVKVHVLLLKSRRFPISRCVNKFKVILPSRPWTICVLVFKLFFSSAYYSAIENGGQWRLRTWKGKSPRTWTWRRARRWWSTTTAPPSSRRAWFSIPSGNMQMFTSPLI